MDEPAGGRAAHGRTPGLVSPRLLAFYQDEIDEGLAAVTGWRIVAWGFALPGGAAVSVPVDGPMAATLWQSVDDAASGGEGGDRG